MARRGARGRGHGGAEAGGRRASGDLAWGRSAARPGAPGEEVVKGGVERRGRAGGEPGDWGRPGRGSDGVSQLRPARRPAPAPTPVARRPGTCLSRSVVGALRGVGCSALEDGPSATCWEKAGRSVREDGGGGGWAFDSLSDLRGLGDLRACAPGACGVQVVRAPGTTGEEEGRGRKGHGSLPSLPTSVWSRAGKLAAS